MITRSIVEGSNPTPLKIFYSYSRSEASFREALDSRLAEYQWDVHVEPWFDGKITPGDAWAEEIDRNLNTADIVLLFVTNAFMRSEYCSKVEVPQALARHTSGNARVIPIILEETDPDWRRSPFSHLQALPQNGVPVSRWNTPEEAYRHITQALINIIVQQGVKSKPKSKWKLTLEGELASFSHADELSVVQTLRQFSGDETLRPVELTNDHISIQFESSGDALQKILSGYKRSSLPLPGWKILLIIELFGAAVQSSAVTVDEALPQVPAVQPAPEVILYPGPAEPATVLTYLAVDASAKAQFHIRLDDGRGPLQPNRIQPTVEARLLDYFFTGLSVKNDEVWVNLSPDDRNRMLPEYLAGTALGRVMIEQDYQLKRLCATLLHPDCDTGRDYWKNVFERARIDFGTTAIPYHSFFRVWIVPDNISLIDGAYPERVAEGKGEAEIAEARLKVLSDREFISAFASPAREHSNQVSELCYAAFEETVLPVVNQQVREGATWVPIREVFNSLVFAAWFKARFASHPFGQQFIETHKRTPIHIEGAVSSMTNLNVPENREFYEKYMDIFKNGVFYTVREDYDLHSQGKIKRAYFAGAIDFRGLSSAIRFKKTKR